MKLPAKIKNNFWVLNVVPITFLILGFICLMILGSCALGLIEYLTVR